MIIHEVNEYKELEAIELTQVWGFNGEELETTIWKQRGCLKDNGTLQKLIKKLETRFNVVEIVGTGKKRKYLLSEPKGEVSSIEDKRKNNKGATSNESNIMTEHIFNCLKRTIGKGDSWSNTKGKWIESMRFIDMNNEDAMLLTEELEMLYMPFHETINVAPMRREAKQGTDTRLNDVFNNGISKLVKSGRIKVEDDYKSKLTSEAHECDKHLAKLGGDEEDVSMFKDLSELEIDSIRQAEEEELELYGIKFHDYFMARVFPQIATKEAKAILGHMDKMLEKEFGIQFYYKSIRISILKPKVEMKVTTEEAQKAFSNRLIHLTNKRQNGQKYSNADTYAKKFYRLNMFLLLRIRGVKGLDEEIEKETSTIKSRIGQVQMSYLDSKVQIEDVQEDNRPWAFGHLAKPKKEPVLDMTELGEFLNTFFDKSEVHSEPSSEVGKVHSEPDKTEGLVQDEPDIKHESTINNKEEVVKVVNEELEYLKRFPTKRKLKQDKQIIKTDYNKLKNTKGYIDIENEEVMKEWQPPTPVIEIQTFGEMLGSKTVAESIKDNKPTFEEYGSLYLMELEKHWKNEAV